MTENFANQAPGRRPRIPGPWAVVALVASALVSALIFGLSGMGPGSHKAAAAPTSTAAPAALTAAAPDQTAPDQTASDQSASDQSAGAAVQDVVFRTEAADVAGDGAFLPADPGPAVLDGPASPGTGELGACDPDRLIQFLADHPDAAAAWVHALDVDPTLHWAGGSQVTVDQIPDYVHSLSATKLDHDTRVTNYFFTNGDAVPFQSLLVYGTAVLVDQDGTPRVRCACGNPLNPPIRISTPPVYTPCDRTPQGCAPQCDWDNDHYGCVPPCYWDDEHRNCTPPCYWDRDHRNCAPPCNWHNQGCVPPCDWDHDRHSCLPPCDSDGRRCPPPPCDRFDHRCPTPCERDAGACPPPVCLTGSVDCRPHHPVQCEGPTCNTLGGTPNGTDPSPVPTHHPVRCDRPTCTSLGGTTTGTEPNPAPTHHPVRCLPAECRSLTGPASDGPAGTAHGGVGNPGRVENRPTHELEKSDRISAPPRFEQREERTGPQARP